MQEVFEKIKYGLMALAEEAYYKSVDGDTNAGQRNSAYHKAIKIIEEVAKDYNNGWISCSERLPSFDERRKSYCRDVYGSGFIVMIEGATMPTTLYIKMEEDIWFDDNYNYYNVIAWQPLPEPYVVV